MKSFTAAATTLAFAGNVAAFWRMPCRSTTGIARIDPLVYPNEVADHSHIVFGGGNFGMNSTFESLARCSGKEDCTTCNVKEDKSAYWTPPLYFQHESGQVEMVPNVGGMLAYYLFYLDDLEPFPEGFQMIAGYPSYRNFTGDFPDAPLSSWPTDPTDQFFLQQRAIGFNCLNYAKTPEASLYRHQFPDKDYMDANCKDGLRMEMAFPSCGNGELDSDDHRSHVKYPSLVKEGNCPEGYDHHYPFLFFETIYATNKFAGMPGKFLVSTGDPVGTSYHADFIMGWDSAEFLGEAIKTCTNPSGQIEDCPVFTLQTDEEAAQCSFPMPAEVEGDDCQGPREGLPVNVPIQYGPEPATAYQVPGNKGQATTSMKQTKAPATYHAPTLTYSPADAASTSTAQGGIVVAMMSEGGEKAAEYGAAHQSVTSAAAYSSATEDSNIVSTTTITKGNEVIEMVIEETEVTVTAQPTAGAYEAPSYKQKRHMEQHMHHHRHAHN